VRQQSLRQRQTRLDQRLQDEFELATDEAFTEIEAED